MRGANSILGLLACLLAGCATVGDVDNARERGAIAGPACDPGANRNAEAAGNEVEHAAEAIRADMAQLLSVIESTHPDPGLSFDPAELRRLSQQLTGEISGAMTAREAWLVLARLNPHFGDAHTGLRHPVAEYEAHLAAGGAAFPAAVFVDRSGMLRASAQATPETGLAPYEAIVAINGQPTEAVVAALMLRMRGETDSIRRLVLSFNFPAHLWTLLGPQNAFCVDIVDRNGSRRRARLPGGNEAGAPVGPAGEQSAKFEIATPAKGVAVLRIASFDPALRDAFASFLDESFETLDKQGTDTLLIDIRDNPGGAHDVSDLLVGYLIDEPVPTASKLVARITDDNRDLDPDAAVGSVVSVPFREPVERKLSRAPFTGRVFVLVSQDTYSQAIVFATTLQDAGVARIIGEVTGGNANQTGQIVITPLAHTQLQALSPIYVIYRPNGDTAMAGLQPDIRLPHDPLAPGRMIEAALRSVAEEKEGRTVP